jgi:hypothetical protein
MSVVGNGWRPLTRIEIFSKLIIKQSMADTVEARVQAGLNMIAIARGNVAIKWHHEPSKIMKIKLRSFGIFNTFVKFGAHDKGTQRDYMEDEQFARVRAMMRTSRYIPIVVFVNGDHEEIPLKSDLIDIRPDIGTKFIGADMMPIDHVPALTVNILQKFVDIQSEAADGRAP